MHFLLVRGRAKTWKNCKTWKNAFFAALREGPNAIQRYPSLSQTLEKLQNPEKSIFCCFARGRKTWLQNLEKCIFCWFPGKFQHYPTLSVLILDPRKIAKPGKMHFYWFAGGPKLGKIAKPGKLHFLLVSGKGSTLSNAIRPYLRPQKNCKTWKNAFLLFCARSQNLEKWQKLEKCIFCWFPGKGPNAIQRYPSLSQTLEKLQNLEKCIFAVLREVAKLGKIAKTGKMHFLLVSGKGPNAIQRYPSLS